MEIDRRGAWFALMCLLVALSACESSVEAPTSAESELADAGPSPDWLKSQMSPPVPKGMVWIAAGALVAGTPKEHLPRKADQEMPGEQVILDGFFIDQYAYPNEQGAIPLSNVTQTEAAELCAERGKRLCSELEWERACKGPRNLTYEYGARYQEQICATGGYAKQLPSGYRFGCRSEFGVHDLHGSLWEWTDSPWGRATRGDDVALRGGNGADGRVVGRCANARREAPDRQDPAIGFRCCQGERNMAEVTLGVNKGKALKRIVNFDRKLLTALENKLPEEIQRKMKQRGIFRMARLWEWKPVANEDLLLAGGCAGDATNRRCGTLIVRRTLGRLDILDWADSGHFVPTVRLEYNPLKAWVYGGDKLSHFRRAVLFDWGDVSIQDIERTVRGLGQPVRVAKTAKDSKEKSEKSRLLAARRKFGVAGAKTPSAAAKSVRAKPKKKPTKPTPKPAAKKKRRTPVRGGQLGSRGD